MTPVGNILGQSSILNGLGLTNANGEGECSRNMEMRRYGQHCPPRPIPWANQKNGSKKPGLSEEDTVGVTERWAPRLKQLVISADSKEDRRL